MIDESISVRAPIFLLWKIQEFIHQLGFFSFLNAHGGLSASPPRLPGMLNTRLNWATVRTAFPPKHLSTTIMFVPFVSQWLRNGPALRCFQGNTSLRCQLDVNGVQPAGAKEQLMESVVLFLLI